MNIIKKLIVIVLMALTTLFFGAISILSISIVLPIVGILLALYITRCLFVLAVTTYKENQAH